MTVEIGILNKHGIALAADSAVTIGDGKGYYNTANKLFSLSKYAPVAIMVYNNAEFMGVPLEIIIKSYRKDLKDKKFDYIEEYWDDFLKYLKAFCIENVSEELDFYYKEMYNLISYIHDKINNEVDIFSDTEGNNLKEDSNKVVINKIAEIIENVIFSVYDFYDSFENDSEFSEIYEEIKSTVMIEIDNLIKLKFGDEFPQALIEKIREICILFLIKKNPNGNRTGIVITGYGEKEIFPTIITGEFLGCFFKRLKYNINTTHKIDCDNDAAILPFAQEDVINTFMTGIDSDIYDIIMDTIDSSTVFEECRKRKKCKDVLKKQIEKKISEASYDFHCSPIIETVAVAPKEELAQMAETLVNLTSFRRKLGLDKFSHTVGGPIDVALLTKGDGLVWLKRKHYFDKDLNRNFFENYYK